MRSVVGAQAPQIDAIGEHYVIRMRLEPIIDLEGVSGYLERDSAVAVDVLGNEVFPVSFGIGEPEVPSFLFSWGPLIAVDVFLEKVLTKVPGHGQSCNLVV